MKKKKRVEVVMRRRRRRRGQGLAGVGRRRTALLRLLVEPVEDERLVQTLRRRQNLLFAPTRGPPVPAQAGGRQLHVRSLPQQVQLPYPAHPPLLLLPVSSARLDPCHRSRCRCSKLLMVQRRKRKRERASLAAAAALPVRRSLRRSLLANLVTAP